MLLPKCYPISLLKDCLEDECALQRGTIDQAQVQNKGSTRVHLSFRVKPAKSISTKNIILTVLEVRNNKELLWSRAGADEQH